MTSSLPGNSFPAHLVSSCSRCQAGGDFANQPQQTFCDSSLCKRRDWLSAAEVNLPWHHIFYFPCLLRVFQRCKSRVGWMCALPACINKSLQKVCLFSTSLCFVPARTPERSCGLSPPGSLCACWATLPKNLWQWSPRKSRGIYSLASRIGCSSAPALSTQWTQICFM